MEQWKNHIEDLEDNYAAETVPARIRSGKELVTDFEEWEAEYDAKRS